MVFYHLTKSSFIFVVILRCCYAVNLSGTCLYLSFHVLAVTSYFVPLYCLKWSMYFEFFIVTALPAKSSRNSDNFVCNPACIHNVSQIKVDWLTQWSNHYLHLVLIKGVPCWTKGVRKHVDRRKMRWHNDRKCDASEPIETETNRDVNIVLHVCFAVNHEV